jgi:hypothetical protein
VVAFHGVGKSNVTISREVVVVGGAATSEEVRRDVATEIASRVGSAALVFVPEDVNDFSQDLTANERLYITDNLGGQQLDNITNRFGAVTMMPPMVSGQIQIEQSPDVRTNHWHNVVLGVRAGLRKHMHPIMSY